MILGINRFFMIHGRVVKRGSDIWHGIYFEITFGLKDMIVLLILNFAKLWQLDEKCCDTFAPQIFDRLQLRFVQKNCTSLSISVCIAILVDTHIRWCFDS